MSSAYLRSPALRPRGTSLRQHVYDDLRRQIRLGEIAGGAKLVDAAIAKSLGISRMPVREALLQLASEGHVRSTSRGFELCRPTARDIAEIFEARKLVEPQVAANAARVLGDDALARMADLVGQARLAVAAADIPALGAANAAFRAIWIAASPNRRLADMLQHFTDQVEIVRHATLVEPRTQKIVLDGMAGLLEAFRQRDTLLAAQRMFLFAHEAEVAYSELPHVRAEREAEGLAPADQT
ncbi:GntR family transcriptional regulator [Gemmobacter sp.]|uniref:GntR family transcriptional regulator n=1 Tax=Gemmobacter sp. TaxID=1898957 RepID=UPI002B003D44|nr:GntR family transcriptional regulator [Gemmobacter sp.]